MHKKTGRILFIELLFISLFTYLPVCEVLAYVVVYLLLQVAILYVASKIIKSGG